MSKLETYHKSYAHLMPFTVTVIYQKDGVFNDMVAEAARKFPALQPLCCDGVKRTVISFVYCPEETNQIFLFATNELTLPVLVHECVHVTMRAFECVGSEMNEHTEEFFAYMQEMLLKDIMKAFIERFKFTPEMTF